MLTFEKFSGINNALPEQRMGSTDLLEASNVDIGLSGEVSRRAGLTQVDAACHTCLWQSEGFMLALREGALLALRPGGQEHVIHPALGGQRVWYCNLPDGRTTYTNGLIHGVTDGTHGLERSVAAPYDLGAPDVLAGGLIPGQYRYGLTFVRSSDRAESPALMSAPLHLAGGLRLDNLPLREGHTLNIYISSLDGEGLFLAGSASGSRFEFSGGNTELVLPCRTVGAAEVPVGTVTAFWRGRVLTAVGDLLVASRPMAPHLHDWQDYKPMGSRITAICPAQDGVYVGTDEDLFFLRGDTWDGLALVRTGDGAVVLGSGVTVPGERIGLGEEEGVGTGPAAVLIAGGELVAAMAGARVVSLTRGRYHTGVKEVWACFRELPGAGPQYMALPL